MRVFESMHMARRARCDGPHRRSSVILAPEHPPSHIASSSTVGNGLFLPPRPIDPQILPTPAADGDALFLRYSLLADCKCAGAAGGIRAAWANGSTVLG